MSKYYNIGDTVGYWTLTYNSKKSPHLYRWWEDVTEMNRIYDTGIKK